MFVKTSKPFSDVVTIEKSAIKIGGIKYKDTGGGFLLEEDPEEPEKEVKRIVVTISIFGLIRFVSGDTNN